MAVNRGIVSSDGVVRSSSRDVEIPDQDFPTFIWSRAIEYADRPALTCGLTKRNYTFSEARSLSRRFGASLLDKGLNPGDVLAIMLPNAIDYPIVLLGALEAGLLVTTIDPAFKKNELSLQVRTTNAKVIVTIPTVVPLVKAVLEELGVTMPIILVNLRGQETGHDIWSYRDLISKSDGSDTQRQWPQISPDDIAILLSSSGTTGERKMVARTHKNTIATMVLSSVYGKSRIISGSVGNDQHSLLMAASLSHLSGQLLVWSGLINGANNFILPVCEPEPLINALTEQKPLSVTCFLYPVMFSELNALIKTDDLEPLRLILTGCSSFIPAHVNAFLAKLPNREEASFYSVFGLTEVLPLFMALQNDQNPLNLGYPEPNTELKVIDARGKSLGPGEVGELCVRGPQVMKGYFNNEKATQDTFDGDWFKTGDTVYYDEDERSPKFPSIPTPGICILPRPRFLTLISACGIPRCHSSSNSTHFCATTTIQGNLKVLHHPSADSEESSKCKNAVLRKRAQKLCRDSKERRKCKIFEIEFSSKFVETLLDEISDEDHAPKKNSAMEAVLMGYIDIRSAFRAQRPKFPGVAPGTIEATAPAPGTFGL
ncbi:unnamed protein product [Bemisia tabaci]|uniref:AMP-dependent synthetase/ligase domain-containing protein n=1 Tax=Bemisia tabaci TaxID=7038 RepID=A0A9P0AN22_BEMTA|nr:unnamed protein product [Bemisia tabaci]